MSKIFFIKRKGQEEIIVPEKEWYREKIISGNNSINANRFQNQFVRGRIEDSNKFQIQNKVSEYYDFLFSEHEAIVLNRWDLMWKFVLGTALILFVIVTYSIYFT